MKNEIISSQKNEANADKAKSRQLENKQAEKLFQKPDYEILKNQDDYILKVYTPGVEKSNVQLTLKKDVLTLTARRSDKVDESWTPISREINVYDYQLSLRLNIAIDEDNIKANVANGVVTINLPIKEAEKPRIINIEG